MGQGGEGATGGGRELDGPSTRTEGPAELVTVLA